MTWSDVPGRDDILAGLTAIANDGIAVAVVWHVLLAVAVGGSLAGWHLSRRMAAPMLAALPASVAACAFLYGNPFNGGAFTLLALLLLSGFLEAAARPVSVESSAFRWLGGSMIAFGWVYPHFLEPRSFLIYAVAAPTGLVPCPTLAILIGLALVMPGVLSRFQRVTLAAYGLFYGAFGMLRLGVWLDAGLVLGAAGLLAAAWRHSTGRVVR